MGSPSAGLAPATLDRVILAGLRQSPKPLEEGEIPGACGLDGDTQVFDRRAALARLVAAGLVQSQPLKILDRERPLLSFRLVTIYWATGGDQ